MSDKIFCGAGKVPKGQTRGSMKQCVEKNQVRYWGVKKVDPKLLEKRGKKSKSASVTRDKIAIKMVGLRGKVSKLSKQLAEEKDKKKQAKIKKELDKAKQEFKETAELFKQLEKKRSQSRTSRKRSNSKKGSRRSRKSRRASRARKSRSKSRKGSKKSRRSRK